MKLKDTIRQRIAFFLLLLFTISVTPKLYFHDVIANHKDVTYCPHLLQSSFCFHQQGLNCHFDLIVVTAPYLLQNHLFSLHLPPCYINSNDTYHAGYTSCFILHKENRGPPAPIA